MTKMHLAWFMNFTPDEWREPFGQGGNPWDGRFYMEMAQTLERACFDYIMIEDKLMVPQTYGGSRDLALKNAMMVPKADPAPLATAMGMATSKLGVVATMSTMAYPPFLLARLCSTIDSLTRGRFGWNIVTSAEDLAAKNFNMDKLPLRETRYEMAEEYMEVVNALFDSWDADAVVLDREKGIYVDPSKVRTIDHVGKHYQVRGPLNTVPSPQHRPVYVQAGASPRGRDFAARFADSIISVASGVAEMKAFRDDIRARAEKVGRNPDDIKIMFCVTPTLAETESEARAKFERQMASPHFIADTLASISAITEIDFAQFDLDQPLPHKLVTNGESGSLDKFQQWGSGKTLRELVTSGGGGLVSSVELIGTPDQVADRMGEVIEEVGGDGFLITTPVLRVSRRYLAEVADGLVPALQKRGLARTEYKHQLLRDTLREF
jgi:FMN-dependent oxidoreductase (nitrilotriacetate monooxygenase family)